MTARPYLGSGSRMVWPPARMPPASRTFDEAPSRIARNASRREILREGRDGQREQHPAAHREDVRSALAAAISPNVRGSSTIGGKKSSVPMTATPGRPGGRRHRRAGRGRRSASRRGAGSVVDAQSCERLGERIGAELRGAAAARRQFGQSDRRDRQNRGLRSPSARMVDRAIRYHARVTVRDTTFGAGDAAVEAYVVAPADGAARAGILFLHWLGDHRSDRTQFLSEASEYAALGVRCVLPAGRLPWVPDPVDAPTDIANIELEQRRLGAALDGLAAGLPKSAPIALVGHDFGAMHGLVLASRHPRRFKAAVLIAATPRWADWFLRFWKLEGDRFDYLRRAGAARPDRGRARPEGDRALAVQRARLLHRADVGGRAGRAPHRASRRSSGTRPITRCEARKRARHAERSCARELGLG